MDSGETNQTKKHYVAPRLIELAESVSAVAIGQTLVSDVASTSDVASLPADVQQQVLDLASQFT